MVRVRVLACVVVGFTETEVANSDVSLLAEAGRRDQVSGTVGRGRRVRVQKAAVKKNGKKGKPASAEDLTTNAT